MISPRWREDGGGRARRHKSIITACTQCLVELRAARIGPERRRLEGNNRVRTNEGLLQKETIRSWGGRRNMVPQFRCVMRMGVGSCFGRRAPAA